MPRRLSHVVGPLLQTRYRGPDRSAWHLRGGLVAQRPHALQRLTGIWAEPSAHRLHRAAGELQLRRNGPGRRFIGLLPDRCARFCQFIRPDRLHRGPHCDRTRFGHHIQSCYGPAAVYAHGDRHGGFRGGRTAVRCSRKLHRHGDARHRLHLHSLHRHPATAQ